MGKRMVEFKIKIHPEQRLAYIPKEIYEALGSELKAVANRTAVILYPKNTDIQDVLKSLEIIQADLQHAIKLQQKAT